MKIRSLLAVTILATASLASAETADQAAARGKQAIKAGRIHEACDAFAASDKLAPSLDTELRLADCYEQDGKPASAARTYRAAADKDTDGPRRRASIAKATKLEARAPRLHWTIEPMPAGLVVEVDGQKADGDDAIVDTGPHEIVATAPGYEGHASVPVDRERTVVPVKIQLEPRAEPAQQAPAQAPAPALAPMPESAAAPAAAPMREDEPASEHASSNHRKRNGIIVGAAGLGVLAGAVIAYEAGSSKFDDADRLCPMQTCANSADLAKGKSLYSDGHTLRDVSLGMGIGGALLVAAGGYLWMTAHNGEAPAVAVQVDPNGAGVTYSARF